MSKTIKLSKETLDILVTASKINNTIKIDEGSIIKTISGDDAVALYAEIKEYFPEQVTIYDLSQFLSILNQQLFSDAVLVFNEDNKVIIKTDNNKVSYWYADSSFVKSADRVSDLDIDAELSFELTGDVLSSVLKGASLLGHKELIVRAVGGEIFLVASTQGIDTSNDLEMKVGTTNQDDCEFKFNLVNMKLMAGDYDVILTTGIAKFVHKTAKCIIYIGTHTE